MAVTVARNSDRTGGSSNGSSEIDNDGPGGVAPPKPVGIYCFVFNCYENIAEAVPQTLTAVTVAQNSNRTGGGGNGSSKIDNDGPGGIAPPAHRYVLFCF